jgi:hypothetical protein
MDKVIFDLKNETQKYQAALQHIDWLVKQFEDNKRELDAYRAGTRENEIIKKKDEQIDELHKKLREYKDKEFLVSEFGFSEEEMADAGKWVEQHYKETKHHGGAAGGNFSYIIIPTGLGIIKEVKCSCGASHTIQDLL